METDYSRIKQLHHLIETKTATKLSGPYKVGVDLGTADVVLVVTDNEGNPVAGSMRWASVVRDGLVVDFRGATSIVEELKDEVEQLIGVKLEKGATAVPPGTVGRNALACGHVIAGAGIEPVSQVDEPVAAAKALNIDHGIVVDIGGGTTGIAVLKNGDLAFTADEPTGGTHISLVLSGAYNIPFAEAEHMKRDESQHRKIMPVIFPVVEKMATIVKDMLAGHREYHDYPVYVVGGTAYLQDFETHFSKAFGRRVHVPPHPLLVTPLGIAMFG
ncbi:ethanolamine utilization protein EutJ [Desulforamulus aquiferis]|uniref:Ethanolamine utilization protein EutJ n=1 Tax=Desulforamulus aquiferis TaxID=1397668 RepID=A0AAW7ZFM9_9FIRM|nr:ethanolamine utilization protein EutJ [Desulforamulus aquiferis]MDO7787836.1 ethanolamine utilization protein EutJ [Desulforamulus aquiferis]RYD04037.1 ethanolamine utilization protein [Desulforamulus aquiferis]